MLISLMSTPKLGLAQHTINPDNLYRLIRNCHTMRTKISFQGTYNTNNISTNVTASEEETLLELRAFKKGQGCARHHDAMT